MQSTFKAIAISFTAVFLSLTFLAPAQENEGLIEARIEFIPNGELTSIRAVGHNHTTAPLFLNYTLTVEKGGTAGQVVNSQKGDFDIGPDQLLELSMVQLSYKPQDHLKVALKIFSGNTLLATDTLFQRPVKKQAAAPALAEVESLVQKMEALKKSNTKAENVAPAEGGNASRRSGLDLEINGLIIDDTRTKIGRDFYDMFFHKWIPPNVATDYIITIKELPNIGRSARVAIVVNDDEVLQRVLSPRQDAIETQVNLSIRVLRNYLKTKDTVSQELGDEDQQGSGIF